MRFLGDLMLNLWDCGGQDNFFDSYLSSQRQTIFNDVAVLIYVFDIEIETRQPTEAVLKEKEKDFEYFYHILDNCRSRSPEAKIFVLINKMDLISGGKKEKDEAYTRKVRELETRAKPVMGDTSLRCFGTSIWDQSLYRVSVLVNEYVAYLPGVLETGLVSNCPYSYSECEPVSSTLEYVLYDLRCDRGCTIRAHHIPYHRAKWA